MTLDEAKKAMVKFVELKTTLRPAFVDPILKAEEVKHGHWVEQEHEDWKWSKEYRCSECGKYRLMTNPVGRGWNYCPNCGAKMDEDRDYEHAVEQLEHDMTFEPTYNPEDGSM